MFGFGIRDKTNKSTVIKKKRYQTNSIINKALPFRMSGYEDSSPRNFNVEMKQYQKSPTLPDIKIVSNLGVKMSSTIGFDTHMSSRLADMRQSKNLSRNVSPQSILPFNSTNFGEF